MTDYDRLRTEYGLSDTSVKVFESGIEEFKKEMVYVVIEASAGRMNTKEFGDKVEEMYEKPFVTGFDCAMNDVTGKTK